MFGMHIFFGHTTRHTRIEAHNRTFMHHHQHIQKEIDEIFGLLISSLQKI